MKRNTHRIYILIIALLLVMNITLYIGKPGGDNSNSHTNNAQVMETEQVRAIDLNTATYWDLTTVKGIGPATAEKIIARREELGQFQSVEDLLSVEDIGEGKYQEFKEYFYVGGEENKD